MSDPEVLDHPRRRAATIFVFVTVTIDMLAFGIVIPVLPFYALELGATPLQVTLLIASCSLFLLSL